MEDSLLWLIHREDSVATSVNSLENCIGHYLDSLDQIRADPHDCDAKAHDIDRYTNYIAETQKELDKRRTELSVIRDDLGLYIKELITSVGENWVG